MQQGETSGRPRQLDVAVGLVIAAAVITVLLGVSLLLQIGPAADSQRALADAQGVTRQQLVEQLTTFAIVALVVSVLYAAALVLAAWRLRRGSRTARIWLIVLTVLAVAPFNVQALLVALVLVVADVLAWRRPVNDWLRRVRP